MVFLVPISWLHLLDFNTLLSPYGELAIERWKIHLLSSGRDLLRISPRRPSGEGLLAVGNPFCGDRPPEQQPQMAWSLDRSHPALCAEAYHAPPPLPGAETEARSIAELFASVTGEPTILLLGSEAKEEYVKARCAGNRMIHLATHGFFCEEDSHRPILDVDRLTDPLLMSGLILTPSATDDGLLTAQELCLLDLRAADWVVLSACNSGLGRLVPGEGLFGLRRALEIAGARTVVMAVWRIHDTQIQDLMAEIYRLRMAGCSTVDAIRDAQLRRLHQQRQRHNRIHPYLWGGIIATGDWR
jgi:CHAT domain-containing protein